MSTDYEQPDLLAYLEVADELATNPHLPRWAHPAGDLVVQSSAGGHFVLGSLPTHPGQDAACRKGVWLFLDMGPVLNVVTCATHGNSIDPARARALAGALTAWADRAEAAT